MNTPIIQDSLKKAITYNSYRELIKNLLSEGKSTGPEQSEALLNFSKLNDKRMDRLDKTLGILTEIQESVNELQSKFTLLVIAEGWCGDAAQVVPVANKIAEASNQVDLKIVLRDENETLMNQFLTNGSKSIPKIIILDDAQNVVDSWGPRPSVPTQMVLDYKERNGKIDDQFKKDLQIWYNKDKGANTQKDIVNILEASQLVCLN